MEQESKSGPEASPARPNGSGPEPIHWTGLPDDPEIETEPAPSWAPPPPGPKPEGAVAAPLRATPLSVPPIELPAVDVLHDDDAHEDEDDEFADDEEEDDEFTYDEEQLGEPITLREVLSPGARLLILITVVTVAGLIAANVLLWQRLEETRTVKTQPTSSEVTTAGLSDLRRRLIRVEAQIAATLDPTGTVATSAPSALLFELAKLRNCVVEFQQAIDQSRGRSGRFKYCS